MFTQPNHTIPDFQRINQPLWEQTFAKKSVDQAGELSPAAIYDPVEQALTDYHDLARLAQNPLITLFNLNACRRRASVEVALRTLLDRTLDSVASTTLSTQSEWHIACYLHLRYRKGIQLCELAHRFGYTEHHLSHLHRELVLEAAEVLLQLHPKW